MQKLTKLQGIEKYTEIEISGYFSKLIDQAGKTVIKHRTF